MKAICAAGQSLPRCVSKRYSEGRGQMSARNWFQRKQLLMCIIELQNRFGWKRPSRSSSPAVHPALPSQGSKHEGPEANFCALQRYRECSYEAGSCGVEADSPKRPVVIIRNAFHEVKLWPRDTANWTIPVIPYSHIEVSGVKVLKVLIKWHKILVWKHAQGYVARKKSASVPQSFPWKRRNRFISKPRAITAACS